MPIIRAKTAGFCLGVSLALSILDRELESPQKSRLVTLGPIIHNPLVIAGYEAKGVLCLNDPSQILPGDRVVIRAHGIPKWVQEQLASLGASIIDATCPKVKKAQLTIARYQQRHGGTLLLFGEEEHPEVQGLISYTTGPAFVFASQSQLASLALTDNGHYFLAAQTTQDKKQFETIIAHLEKRLSTPVTVLHTICNATRERQNEVLRLAKNVDAMVVVGGKNSGNTRRLAEISHENGIPTFHVEQPSELAPKALQDFSTIGLTAGASTPDSHIDTMQMFLERLNTPS